MSQSLAHTVDALAGTHAGQGSINQAPGIIALRAKRNDSLLRVSPWFSLSSVLKSFRKCRFIDRVGTVRLRLTAASTVQAIALT